MPNKIIYLDYAAATPLDSQAFAAMEPYFSEHFFNPSSAYQPAREVRQAIQAARESMARIIGAKPDGIIFTAGASESISLGFHGVLSKGGHVVVSAIEHAAVLETAKNFNHSLVLVGQDGRVNIQDLAHVIREDTLLVSIGMVNNEIGTIQPLREIAALLQQIRTKRLAEGNLKPLFFHTDASQAAGMLELNVNRLGVDLLTLNGAKMYGPKQTGLLWARSSIVLAPLIRGGGQEKGLRSGTENVAGIIGLSEAFSIVSSRRVTEVERVRKLRDLFLFYMKESFDKLIWLGDPNHNAPHILTLSWPGLDAERALFSLDMQGVLVATGAACAARKETRSYVLSSLGLSDEIIDGSLRFSFGRGNDMAQLKRAAKIITNVIKKEINRT